MRIGSFTLDQVQRQLVQADQVIRLSPKAFQLLEVLAQKSPEPLSKEQIHRILWPNEFVEDGSLHNLVSEIRSVLGEDRDLLRTLPRFGYALTTTSISPFCLVSGETAYPLRIGTNIVGRGTHADVPVELPGVSREHARVTTSANEARVEDLGSKNGTFVGKRRVIVPVPLRDGDELFLGRARLLFRVDRRRMSTATDSAVAEARLRGRTNRRD